MLLAALALPADYSVVYGAPATVWLSLNVSNLDPVIYFTLMLYNKVEACSLELSPELCCIASSDETLR